MSRSSLFALMALIEGSAGFFALLSPDLFRQKLLGSALPGLGETGVQVVGLGLIGVALLCLLGLWRSDWPQTFATMLGYNVLAAAGLVGVAILTGPAGPLFWPAVLVHTALVGLQVMALRST